MIDFPRPWILREGELDETDLPISTNPYREPTEEPKKPAMLEERLADPRKDGTAPKTTHDAAMILEPFN